MTSQTSNFLSGFKSLAWRNINAFWAFALIGAALPLGVFFYLGSDVSRFGVSFVVMLLVMCFWTVVAVPAAAAGGERRISCWLRGGIVLDMNAAVLLVIWLLSINKGLDWPILSFVWIYLILTAQGVMSLVLVSLTEAGYARLVMAVLATILGVLVLSTPFYMAAFVNVFGDSGPLWAVRVNPFWTSSQMVVEQTHVYWRQEGILYQMFDFEAWDHLLPVKEIVWWRPVAIYLATAGFFFVFGALGRWRLKRFSPIVRPVSPPINERPDRDD